MFEQRRSVAILPLIASLVGLSFCLLIILAPHFESNAADCVATGCTLYENINIAGISLWHIGAVAFSGLAFCALRGHVTIAYMASACMLIGDVVLLALLAFTAPCTNCLIVASLFAITFWLFRNEKMYQSVASIVASSSDTSSASRSYLLIVWALFFFSNCLAVINERMEPWIIHGPADAPMRIYFSPSCPSCREAIRTYGTSNTPIAFLPVTEDDADLYAIATLEEELANGKNFFPAFRYATNENNVIKELSLATYIELQWRVLRNKVRFYASGSTTLPLIQMHGMPKVVANHLKSPAPTVGQQKNVYAPATPMGTGIPMGSALQFEGCSDDSAATPCPTE